MTRDLTDDFNPEWNPDLIVGHPFQPGRPPLEPTECGHIVQDARKLAGGLPCGFSLEDHADQGDDQE